MTRCTAKAARRACFPSALRIQKCRSPLSLLGTGLDSNSSVRQDRAWKHHMGSGRLEGIPRVIIRMMKAPSSIMNRPKKPEPESRRRRKEKHADLSTRPFSPNRGCRGTCRRSEGYATPDIPPVDRPSVYRSVMRSVGYSGLPVGSPLVPSSSTMGSMREWSSDSAT